MMKVKCTKKDHTQATFPILAYSKMGYCGHHYFLRVNRDYLWCALTDPNIDILAEELSGTDLVELNSGDTVTLTQE